MLLSKATYNLHLQVCLSEEGQTIYIAVGTVRMFIEPSAKHWQSLGQPIPRIQER